MEKYYVITYFQIINGRGMVTNGTRIFKTETEAQKEYNDAVNMILAWNDKNGGRVCSNIPYSEFGYKTMAGDYEYVTMNFVSVI